MTASKEVLAKQALRDSLRPRVIGTGDPAVYTHDELKALIHIGRRYGHGLMKARRAAAGIEQAEAFRRRCEIIWIFRDLPERHRKRPSGQETKDAVLYHLEKVGITISERTLMRDYRILGGTKFLRSARPFAPGEDRSSPCPTEQAEASPSR